jgi:hypothetical protein
MSKYPVIRKLEDGGVCVDYGRVWYRCHPDGRIVKKWADHGRSHQREASTEEYLRIEPLAFGDKS